MIKSFSDKETEKIFNRQFSRRFLEEIQRAARRKLEILNAAENLNDLRIPPSNRLEKLVGNRKGQHSIRINNQWGAFVLSGEKPTLSKLKLWIITKRSRKMEKQPPIHPGEILLEEFLKPLEISRYCLANDINVSPRRINEIVLGKRAVTPDTALRLSRYFGLSERFWINLQMRFDLETEKDKLADRLEKEVRVLKTA